jgi:hypothetical protein
MNDDALESMGKRQRLTSKMQVASDIDPSQATRASVDQRSSSLKIDTL